MTISNGTIQYNIKEDGFVYHIKKAHLKKGSTISKKKHPIPRVESFKEMLVEKGWIVDKGTHYECNRNIKTGLLMAYNLHHGSLKKKIEIPNAKLIINGSVGEDEEIKESFSIKNTHSADDKFWRNLEKDCCEISKVIKATMDLEFFERKKDDSFSKAEQFVADALVISGILNGYRRGEAFLKKECDIVDEDNHRQIEIVNFLDDKVRMFRFKHKPDSVEQSLLCEYIDMGTNIVPAGVIKKFTDKDYSDQYDKELAIYMIGSRMQARKKMEQLQRELEKEKEHIRNNFQKVHIIIHDPLISESFILCSADKVEIFSDKECSVNPIEHRIVEESEIKADEKYFMVRKNIFSGDEQLLWMTGEDILKFKIMEC